VRLFTSFPCNYGNYHSHDVAHTEDKNTGTTLEKPSIKKSLLKETGNFKVGPDYTYIHWRLNTPILPFTHGFLILTNSRWVKDFR